VRGCTTSWAHKCNALCVWGRTLVATTIKVTGLEYTNTTIFIWVSHTLGSSQVWTVHKEKTALARCVLLLCVCVLPLCVCVIGIKISYLNNLT
jgi:hypothetical protein